MVRLLQCGLYFTTTTTTTRLVPAISEGYTRRVQEKKENSINIYTPISIKVAYGFGH